MSLDDSNPTPENHDLEAMAVEQPRRAASIQLTSDEVRERRSASFEAARSSLSEALRITYRILQGGMALLVLLFLLSGFRQIEESERGVRVQFGRVIGQELEPGSHFSLPRPIGDVRTVDVGAETIALDDVFFERLSDAERRQSYATNSGSRTLVPGRDGSLVTADGSLVHMRLSVTFRRADIAAYIGGLIPAEETDVVESLIQRVTIAVIAEKTVDAIVGGASVDGSLVEGAPSQRLAIQAELQRRSRALLDDMGLGIEIESVTITDAYVPGQVGQEFRTVSTAVSEAQGAIDEAQATREQSLTQTAGSAYRVLLELLDEYERLVDINELERAEEFLSLIYAVFDGEYADSGFEWEGAAYGPISLGGEAAGLITLAGTYEAQVVSNAEALSRIFEAKLGAYRENPEPFIAREWADAMTELTDAMRTFEVFSVPDAIETFRLLLNEDPEIRRRSEQVQNLQERIESERRRNNVAGVEFEG